MKQHTEGQFKPINNGIPVFALMSEKDSIELIDELLINDLLTDALTHTKRSKSRFPNNQAFDRREADIYFRQESYDKALWIYDTIESQQESPKRLLSLAIKKMNCNKLAEAEEMARELRLHESVDISSRAYAVLSDIAFLKHDYKNMYRWAREAIKRNPFLDSFAEKFYVAVELTNNHHKSIPFYETLIDENPYSSAMWLHLSKCHEKLGFKTQANDCLNMVSMIETSI